MMLFLSSKMIICSHSGMVSLNLDETSQWIQIKILLIQLCLFELSKGWLFRELTGAINFKFIRFFVYIPPITEANQHIATQIEEIVDQILDAKQTDPNADTSDLENEIDRLVSELYGLTEDEIAIVAGSV